MSEKITKADFVARLSERLGLSQQKAGETLDHIVEEIVSQLQQGKSLTLTGLGTWLVKDRPARSGRNPATGKSIKIPARKVLHCKVGKQLKEAVNV